MKVAYDDGKFVTDTKIANSVSGLAAYLNSDKNKVREVRKIRERILESANAKSNPRALEPATTHLNNLASVLAAKGDGTSMKFDDPDLHAIMALPSNMENWQGHLRDKFVENYAVHVPAIAKNQGLVAAVLRDRVITLGHCYENYRRGLRRIGGHAVTAVEGITASGGKSFTVNMAATIAVGTAATGIAGVLTSGVLPSTFTAAGAIGAGLGVLGSVAIIAGTLAGAFAATSEEVPLGGDNVRQVYENVMAALDKLDERFADEESKVFTGMRKVTADISHFAKSDAGNQLIPITPRSDGNVRDGDLVVYA